MAHNVAQFLRRHSSKREFREKEKAENAVAMARESQSHSSAGNAALEQREFLARVTLHDILAEREAKDLIDASAESNVRDAVKLMADARIKHLPIFSLTPTPAGPEKFYIGVVSVSDILCGLTEEGVDNADRFRLTDLLKSMSRLWTYPSFHHLDVVLQPILSGQPAVLIQRYREHKKGPLAIITQTDIGRFLLKNIDKMDATLLDTKLGDTPLGVKAHFDASFTVKCSKTAGHAFHRMHFYHHESLAVVDDGLKVVANLSASDLRGLSQDDLSSLEEHGVLEFLQKRSGKSDHRAPVTITPSATVKEALRVLVTEHINQVWVVSEPDSYLISQVLLTEIIEMFLRHPYEL